MPAVRPDTSDTRACGKLCDMLPLATYTMDKDLELQVMSDAVLYLLTFINSVTTCYLKQAVEC